MTSTNNKGASSALSAPAGSVIRATKDRQVDRIVTDWHSGKIAGVELHEALGWSIEEYAHWAETSKIPASPNVKDISARR